MIDGDVVQNELAQSRIDGEDVNHFFEGVVNSFFDRIILSLHAN